jgi:hypothetical protein
VLASVPRQQHDPSATSIIISALDSRCEERRVGACRHDQKGQRRAGNEGVRRRPTNFHREQAASTIAPHAAMIHCVCSKTSGRSAWASAKTSRRERDERRQRDEADDKH